MPDLIEVGVSVVLRDGSEADCGRLVFSPPDRQGRYRSEFQYSPVWLRHPHRFALDPESLPLTSEVASGDNLFPPLSVFEDALPDRWGRRLMAEAYHLPLRRQSEPYLLGLTGRGGLGALRFEWKGEAALLASRVATVPATARDLVDLLRAADAFEKGQPIDDAGFERLLRAGQTPGGARPKALIRHAGAEWVAKFPSAVLDEGLDIVGLEEASLATAREAGLVVPDHELMTVGRRRVLMVRRFDVVASDLAETGRTHMISLRTLCKERPGAEVLEYGALARAVRRHSAQPEADVEHLYRLMVFNAALGNTDDHLKNFWMLHADSGWRLSPAFDLLPDAYRRREHALSFNLFAGAPKREDLALVAAQWNVRNGLAVVDKVADAVNRFAAIATHTRVERSTVQTVLADIEHRVALLSKAKRRNRAAPSRGDAP